MPGSSRASASAAETVFFLHPFSGGFMTAPAVGLKKNRQIAPAI
jgi:hypothetical protein